MSIVNYLDVLCQRVLQDGSFSGRMGGNYRPDATAWAILALAASNVAPEIIRRARLRLVADQFEDGRISISPDSPDAFWPTPLAILAWQGCTECRQYQLRATRFLLRTTGVHWQKTPDSPLGHDTLIHGWPWVMNTHSWVEPTALALLALQAVRYEDREIPVLLDKQREQEATRMLVNRMLPHGGWNQGGTFVFGQELRPSPDSTGVALNALAGRTPRESVQLSLNCLKFQLERVRTPLSLGWGILGLGAWGERPKDSQEWIIESLQRQKRLGEYDTAQLSLLLVATQATGGLLSVLPEQEESP